MEALDLLTKKDLENIEAYMFSYGGYGGNDIGSLDNVGHLLRFWDAGKSGFLCSLMGHNLILEREINIQTPETILQEEMEAALFPSDGIDFVNKFYKWINTLDYHDYANLCQLMAVEDLVHNTYKGQSFEISVPDQKHPLQINRGCKIVKTLGKIAQLFNIEGFEEFRLKHSMVLNQKRFKGTLCLSIHPLDYMTMSDNDSNWDSCMSWRKPGEYREGTVEMMNSSNVIVAYLKAEEDMYLFPWNQDETSKWNNKRWRKLYVVTPDLMTGIKGYPYNDKILEAEIFKWLLELSKTNCPYNKYDEPIPYKYGESFRYHEVEMSVWYKFKIMYDDFGGVHIGYFSPSILNKLDKYNNYQLTLSGPTMCLQCGSAWEDVSSWDTQSLLCPDCTGEVKCNECGDFTYIESCHVVEGNYMCSYCAEYYTNTCDYCEDLYYKENTTPIYLTHDDEVFLDEKFYLCNNCMSECCCNLDEHYGRIYETRHPRRLWAGNIHTINSDNMTLNGFRAFGYFGETVEEAREKMN